VEVGFGCLFAAGVEARSLEAGVEHLLFPRFLAGVDARRHALVEIGIGRLQPGANRGRSSPHSTHYGDYVGSATALCSVETLYTVRVAARTTPLTTCATCWSAGSASSTGSISRQRRAPETTPDARKHQRARGSPGSFRLDATRAIVGDPPAPPRSTRQPWRNGCQWAVATGGAS
jgi:hypothetical protein